MSLLRSLLLKKLAAQSYAHLVVVKLGSGGPVPDSAFGQQHFGEAGTSMGAMVCFHVGHCLL